MSLVSPDEGMEEWGGMVREMKEREEGDTARLVFSKKEWDDSIRSMS